MWLAQGARLVLVLHAGCTDKPETACLLAKSSGIIAGRPYVDGALSWNVDPLRRRRAHHACSHRSWFPPAVFEQVGCKVNWLVQDGAQVEPIMLIATVTGPCRNILLAERTALNVITRASGIATQVRTRAPWQAWRCLTEVEACRCVLFACLVPCARREQSVNLLTKRGGTAQFVGRGKQHQVCAHARHVVLALVHHLLPGAQGSN